MPSKQYPDVCVDVETTGTNAGRHAIIQLAAVRFNLAERTVDLNVFNRCLFPAPHRAWSESTRSWWLQRKDTLRSIIDRFECPRLVMNDFIDWCGYGEEYRFWSRPSHFDYNFVSSYLEDYELPNPFPYWKVMDIRSYLRGRAGHPDNYSDPTIDFQGTKHDALFDALHEVDSLFAGEDIYRV